MQSQISTFKSSWQHFYGKLWILPKDFSWNPGVVYARCGQKIVGSNPRHGGRCQARCCLWLKYYALFMIIWGEIRKKLKEVVSSICSALTPLKVQTDVWQYNWSCLEPDAIEQTACRQGFKIAHGWIWKVLATKKGLKFRCFFSFLGCPQPQCSDTFPASDGGFLSCQCLLNSNSVV
jgi:hypothetical protein